MSKAVIAGYVRSPFTPAHKGALAKTRPDEIAGQVVRALVERSKVNPEDIEDILMGCAFPEGEQGFNIGRIVAFLAELPLSVSGMTINRFCGSSMQAVHIAAGNIAAGMGDVFICAGVESMTRIPIGGFNPLPHPGLMKTMPQVYISMGMTAENVAKQYNVSREDQEQFALSSQQKTVKAVEQGLLRDEIVPITTPDGVVDRDGCPRPETTAEGLADLNPAFLAGGSVTAGTSSPLTDGAAAVLVCSEEYASKHGLEVLARVHSFAVAGCAPEIMGMGPVRATYKVLERAGIGEDAIDVVELNEAFASQSLACMRELDLDPAKINLDGGAIALGHPLGATGARITGKAASLLKRSGGNYALATQCIGGGQGIATVLERI